MYYVTKFQITKNLIKFECGQTDPCLGPYAIMRSMGYSSPVTVVSLLRIVLIVRSDYCICWIILFYFLLSFTFWYVLYRGESISISFTYVVRPALGTINRSNNFDTARVFPNYDRKVLYLHTQLFFLVSHLQRKKRNSIRIIVFSSAATYDRFSRNMPFSAHVENNKGYI